MWELDHNEGWALKNWCFWIVVVEKTCEFLEQQFNPEGNQPCISLEGLMLKLKLQYFGHLMQRADSLERPWCWDRLRAGGEDRGWDRWMASLIRWTWVWTKSRRWDPRTGMPGMVWWCSSWGHKETDRTEQSNNNHHHEANVWCTNVCWAMQSNGTQRNFNKQTLVGSALSTTSSLFHSYL